MKKNEREIAVGIIEKVSNGGYSLALLEDKNPQAAPFVRALVLGAVEKRLLLNFVIRMFSKREFDSIDPHTLAVLQAGLYQLMFMDVVEYAAVSETVSCARDKARRGFANAVLRGYLKERERVKTELSALSQKDELLRLSVEYSFPRRLVKAWFEYLGEKRTREILKFPPAKLYARYIDGTASTAWTESSPCMPCKVITRVPVTACEDFKAGLFFVQDKSSQKYCDAVLERLGNVQTPRVLDLCAAPGGKTFALACGIAERGGSVVSCDAAYDKLYKIKNGAARLKLNNIKVMHNNAAVHNTAFAEHKFDCVMTDVPCSGLGVFRRKPEVKYKTAAEVAGLPEIQRKILETSAAYVKRGGLLCYSTCTLSRAENEDVTDGFLRGFADFERVTQKVITPLDFDGDGFYYCIMRRHE